MSKQQKNQIQKQKQKQKMIFQVKWKVSKYRQDKRTGPTTVYPRSKYTSHLMEEETKRIRGTN